jgi:hypothetical protein
VCPAACAGRSRPSKQTGSLRLSPDCAPDSTATTSVSLVWINAASSGPWFSMLLSVVISPSHGDVSAGARPTAPSPPGRASGIDLVDAHELSVGPDVRQNSDDQVGEVVIQCKQPGHPRPAQRSGGS